MRILYLAIAVFFMSSLNSCQSDPNDKSDEVIHELCACVNTEGGKWDMSLTKECMELCVQEFGAELKGMDEWFKEYCGKIEIETKVKPSEEVQI